MKLNFSEYKDKVYACWVGKNIGGTMGTPYEGRRETQNITGFVTEPNVILPNDDLDLQLVWLHAVESIGPYGLDSKKLGEFWLSYITPFWNEYGIGKVNMKRGLVPPLSGDYENTWSHSNGAWIRTEIWASLAPASPDTAAKYAIEDAMVDHGAGEGTVAAAFIAAMQSAAFVEKDIRTLIEIGLAKIPQESRVAKSIRLLISCYESGVPAMEARERILEQNADIGDGWFEAPSNVAYTVLGLLYGEGDFKKSMITAINCGDDTDCTGATVGATLGIIGGLSAIPEDWKAYIGDGIVTISLAGGVLGGIPKTCTELTDRVAAAAPVMLIAGKTGVSLTDGKTEIPDNVGAGFKKGGRTLERLKALKPYQFDMDLGVASVSVTFDGAPDIRPDGEKKIHLRFKNNVEVYGSVPYYLELRWILPEGFYVEDGQSSVRLPHVNAHYDGTYDMDVTVRAVDGVEPVNRLVLEVIAEGRGQARYVPIVLLG